MRNELTIFKNEEFGEVRTVMIDNEVWFLAKDVCNCLCVKNVSDAINKLDEDEKGIVLTDTLGGKQEMTYINESGLYNLVLSSRKPEAKRFKKWVTSEVLPSIRKTGSYSIVPKTYLEALKELVITIEEKERLEIENKQMQPKALFYDTVTKSGTWFDFVEVAKIINRKGFGRNTLMKFLREKNILRLNNTPYQCFADRGYFKIVENYFLKSGEIEIGIKTVVSQKGIDYILKLLKKISLYKEDF